MVEERSYYFPEEIKEIVRAYEEVRKYIKGDKSLDATNISQDEIRKKLKEAIERYNLIVPGNMRGTLTGLLFE